MFNKVAIIGVGLMGGSLAAAIKAKKLASHIIGIGRQQNPLNEALALGLVDSVSLDIKAVFDCDLIVLCMPVAQIENTLLTMYPHLTSTVLITDVGSTKQDVVMAAKRVLGDGSSKQDKIRQFIPAHPIAGKAQHGPTAADANLYVNKRVIITPLPENTPEALLQIINLWKLIGAHTSQMSPLHHDTIFASVSHLPHLLAYALVAQITQSEDAQVKFSHAGAGFRDFTRIAASSPEMWRDIFFANKNALLNDLRTYQAVLDAMASMLITNNVAGLESMITKAATTRQLWDDQL